MLLASSGPFADGWSTDANYVLAMSPQQRLVYGYYLRPLGPFAVGWSTDATCILWALSPAASLLMLLASSGPFRRRLVY
jgi:hypothetical protein